MGHPRRLIEVDLPIRRISMHARREKNIRHGHISTLHIWWARRPLAACRAVVCASLWPDPADPACPKAFLAAAKREMLAWSTHERQQLLSPDSREIFETARKTASALEDKYNLRSALLNFIADFANWDYSKSPPFLETSRVLTGAAHLALGGEAGTNPMVVDPFAGGGAIPLEAARIGADTFASDLNPVSVLLNRVLLEYVPSFREELVDAFVSCAERIASECRSELSRYYPPLNSGENPAAYIWARTVLSEAPSSSGRPIEVPLLKSMVLLRKKGRYRAFRWVRTSSGKVATKTKTVTYADGRTIQVLQPQIEIYQPRSLAEVEKGTTAGGAVTCPVTGFTNSVESVREQLLKRKGGAADARLLCVVTTDTGRSGKTYRAPEASDLEGVELAQRDLRRRIDAHSGDSSYVPDGELNHLRGFFNVVLYGMSTWGDLFSPRQLLALTTVADKVRDLPEKFDSGTLRVAVQTCLALALDRCADKCASLVVWDNTRDMATHVFGRQALPMVWDFAEVNLLSDNGWTGAVTWIRKVLEANVSANFHPGTVVNASATEHPLPDDSADLVATDPPYYAAIPYADLSDFFYSWLKRSIGGTHPDLLARNLSPKDDECVSLSHRAAMYRHKDGAWFEETMRKACYEARRVARPDGLGMFVFANKETAGWEAMLNALIRSGWIVTASWPIDTEMGNRLRARNSATLSSSIHLVCRPREADDGALLESVGEWRNILAKLPERIENWLPRLAAEGVVGADAIFACLGPALEIYSRYSSVEKASGAKVELREYLEQVWAEVARQALSMIFEGSDTGGLEEDARLTAMWLWTLRTDTESDTEVSEKIERIAGYTLAYDAARKIAQGLGCHLENLAHLVEIKGENATLLSAASRARYLFGKEYATAPRKLEKRKTAQGDLFAELGLPTGEDLDRERAKLERPVAGDTVLDQLHQSMILFGAGRGQALQRFLVDDGVGSNAQLWSLAQSLSALYPLQSEEKRWVDGVLARKKGLGF